jgi:hypothetical protein
MGLTNCKFMMTEYVYSQNPLYELNLPLSLIAGIIFYKVYDKKIKTTFSRIALPLVVVILVYFVISTTADLFVDNKKLNHLIEVCETLKKRKEPIIFPEEVIQYANTKQMNKNVKEHFSLFGYHFGENEPEPELKKQMNVHDTISTAMKNIHQNTSISMPSLSGNNPQDTDGYDLDIKPYTTYERPLQLRTKDRLHSNCLLGTDPCSPLCSGDSKNPCGIVAPIPSTAWQPRSAEAVQQSLSRGEYSASNCPFNLEPQLYH